MRYDPKMQPIPAATKAARIAQNTRDKNGPPPFLSDKIEMAGLGREVEGSFPRAPQSPDAGTSLADVDYSELEARVLAHGGDRFVLDSLPEGLRSPTGRTCKSPRFKRLP